MIDLIAQIISIIIMIPFVVLGIGLSIIWNSYLLIQSFVVDIERKLKKSKMIKSFKSRWTMKPTGASFMDVVTLDLVQYWEDCYGDKWMAVSKWGFRIKIGGN
jgi:hypothetical protein